MPKSSRRAPAGDALPQVNTRVLPSLHAQLRSDTGDPAHGRENYGQVTQMVNLALGMLSALPEDTRVWWSLDCRPQNGDAKVMAAIRSTWGWQALNCIGRLPEDRREDALAAIRELCEQSGASTPRAASNSRRRRGRSAGA